MTRRKRHKFCIFNDELSWLFTSAAEKLKQGLQGKNSTSGQDES